MFLIVCRPSSAMALTCSTRAACASVAISLLADFVSLLNSCRAVASLARRLGLFSDIAVGGAWVRLRRPAQLDTRRHERDHLAADPCDATSGREHEPRREFPAPLQIID